MKKKKNYFILISLMFLFSCTLSVTASDKKENISDDVTSIGLGIDDDQLNIIKPKYIPSCPDSSGKHLMKGRGKGWAYYGAAPSKDLRLTGQAAQCSNCHVVVITENNLFLNPSLPWGKYAMWNPGYKVGNGVVMYTKSFGKITKKNDPFALGFVFN